MIKSYFGASSWEIIKSTIWDKFKAAGGAEVTPGARAHPRRPLLGLGSVRVGDVQSPAISQEPKRLLKVKNDILCV